MKGIAADEQQILVGFAGGHVSRKRAADHIRADYAQLGAVTGELAANIAAQASTQTDRIRLTPLVTVLRELSAEATQGSADAARSDFVAFEQVQTKLAALAQQFTSVSRQELRSSACVMTA